MHQTKMFMTIVVVGTSNALLSGVSQVDKHTRWQRRTHEDKLIGSVGRFGTVSSRPVEPMDTVKLN